jgi:hypothetical protein
MRILIVWEEIPETTKFYILDIEDQKIIDKIKKANGQIINLTEKDDDAQWLGEFLDGRDQITLVEGKPINIDSVELLIFLIVELRRKNLINTVACSIRNMI